jgi:beta-xylosidase
VTANEKKFAPQTSDEFDSPKLGLQWQWNANHADDWHSLKTRKGWLRLFPQFASSENPMQLPNLLLQKFPARSFAIETLLEFAPKQIGEEAGLIITGESFATLSLQKNNSGNQLVLRINGIQKFVHDNTPSLVKLRVAVKNGGLCIFSFAVENNFVTIPETLQAQKGVWIGAKVGLFSLKRVENTVAGHVDADYFHFE